MATFHFHLVAPDKMTFSGEVDQVDVPGTEGDFGVLAGHAPTVSLLRPGILTVYAGGQKVEIVVLGGFAEVSEAGLTVLADVRNERAGALRDIDQAHGQLGQPFKHAAALDEAMPGVEGDTRFVHR